ncbi:NAD(P)-dependent oxidoreductase [Paenibacillus methanolicus]|uniref:3-hydroxyisobutyrate dehydrogenase-like beta-hydroxyacid dehydrogenase n=1 Tax=Paenibacillus methanolicus TaxID=582686 RepID=A0A5S5CBU0_9BACL|nr:NAD(P)-binding domain-containing protein [Paenibacillus methanolicus]TYP76824.1 3-hydroxyisobutyrate dehydrogenase-like beta-hydroxyacid dehydrogenase [Paenibacillus methanolicus]
MNGNSFAKASVHKYSEGLIPVSVIGLGNMGQALAATFLAAGHPVTVWNRSAGKDERLVGNGAGRAETAADAVAASRIIVVCLSTYEVVRSTFMPLKTELAGRVIVNLTTGTPDDARRMSAWAEEAGIDYLDGAIMAIPPMIGSPEALLLYGGRKELFEAYQPVLRLLGGHTTYLSEDPGVALLHDLAMLTMMYGAWYSYFHAHALLRTAHISAEAFLPYSSNWLQHLIVPMLTNMEAARKLDEGDYATDISNMTINKLGLDNIVKSSQELGVPADWLLPIQAVADQMVAMGYGNDGFDRVIEAMTNHRSHGGDPADAIE